jgi:hypothetical protein
MRLFISIITLLALSLSAQNLDRTDRLNNIEVVNVGSGDDSTIMGASRVIKSDCDCLIKYRIRREKTKDSEYNVTDSLVGGVWYSVGPIVRVYRYTYGTTETTCKTMDSTATERTQRTGVKIAR